MLLFHVWPEQTYRFSTRKFLPSKKNRFSKQLKPVIPYNLIKSKSSKIPRMKEINVVGLGLSFDLNNLSQLEGPVFLVSFWSPLKINSVGKVTYNHIFSYKLGKQKTIDEIYSNNPDNEILKKKLVYLNSREAVVSKLKESGYKVLSVNVYPNDEKMETGSYLNNFDHDQCKRIVLEENVYQSSPLKSQPDWAPTKSFLPNLCALSFFAEKINVYGWDYYLENSPQEMGYWQLFFNMYKYKIDIGQSKDHFESALINYYYGYQLSKLPNFKIYGHMGKLSKHHKLIKRIERVLFN